MGVLNNSFVDCAKRAGNYVYNKIDRLSGVFNDHAHQVLDNGIKASYSPNYDGRFTKVSVQLNVGGMHDPKGQEGLAHFTEHMVLRQNEDIAKRVQRELAKIGGSMNAFTVPEMTVYNFQVPNSSKNNAQLFDLISDVLFYPEIDERYFENEKTVIANEIAMRRDHLRNMPWVNAVDVAYGKDDLAHFVIGTNESVNGITVDDMYAFHRENYVGQNISFSITSPASAGALFNHLRRIGSDVAAGGVNGQSPRMDQSAGELFNHLRRIGSAIPSGSADGQTPQPEMSADNENPVTYQGGYRHIEDKDVEQTYFITAFDIGPSGGAREAVKESVLASYLATSFVEKIRGIDDCKTYSVFAQPFRFGPANLFIMGTDCLPEQRHEILPIIADTIREVAEGHIDPELLEVAKGQETFKHYDNAEQKSRDGDKQERLFTSMVSETRWKHTLKKITGDDLTKLAADKLACCTPTLILRGDIEGVQSYDEFKKMLPGNGSAADRDAKFFTEFNVAPC